MAVSVQSYLEDILGNVSSYVGSTYSTYLDAMETLKGSAYVMEDMAVRTVGDVNVFAGDQYPIMFLFPQELAIDELDLNDEEINVSLLVVIVLKGQDLEELLAKAMRYMDCLRQMVIDDRTLGGAVDTARMQRVNYYSTGPGDEGIIEIESILALTKTVAMTL